METLVLLPGSYFCDILTSGIYLYFLSYIIAGGCYILRIYVKNFFSIPIKFLFCKRLGWSATKRDGQTLSVKTAYVNETGIFSYFLYAFEESVDCHLLSIFCDDSNLHRSIFKYVLSTMGVSKESISKCSIGNRFHVKLRI